MITDWEAYGHAWDKYSDAIVQVLKTTDSATIGTAFECLASLGRSRARHVADASFDPNDELLFRYAAIIRMARLIALKASFTKREGEKQEEVVTKAEDELPIAPLATATASPPPNSTPC
jgi:hypothetical protein